MDIIQSQMSDDESIVYFKMPSVMAKKGEN